jgi:ABC-type phosphate/phosphonate transport system substrate-binding protein
MSLKANLPMYDWPETSEALDQFWHLFSQTLNNIGYDLPDQLDRQAGEAIWQDQQLAVSQTCGFPLVHTLKESVTVLGTPTFNCDYFVDGHYASVILTRADDKRQYLHEFAGSTVAINSMHSQSGFNALRNLLFEQHLINHDKPGFFAKAHMSGGHRYSMQAVADKQADVCAIDPVSYALAQRYDATTGSLKVIDCTASTPGLPLICSQSLFATTEEFAQWKNAVQDAWKIAASDSVAKPLLLDGIVDIPRAAYNTVACHDLSLLQASF